MAYFSLIYFAIGVIVVVVFAWPQFDKPSFQTQAALPRTVDPLRYLFLKSAYNRARLIYVAVLVLFYFILVLAGPSLARIVNVSYDPNTWPLLIALVLVGVLPNQKWLTAIEDFVRRRVHAWFLVPEGTVDTIAVLEDTVYEPSQDQLEAVTNPARRAKLARDLKLPVGTLQYRWARATMLMASLLQMHAPLKRGAFEPFELDFQDILTSYKALEQVIEQFQNDSADGKSEDNLIQQIEKLLKRIYAYISWGVRYQAATEQNVDDILAQLGFRVPPTGGRQLFDIIAIPVIFLFVITFVLRLEYLFYFPVPGAPQKPEAKILWAFSSAISSAFMYWSGMAIALKQRGNQIDQGRWREGSPACLLPIGNWSGLIAWGIIAATSVFVTMVYQPVELANSVTALMQKVGMAGSEQDVSQQWPFFPELLISAAPWFLVGAVASGMLAWMVGRNVVEEGISSRIHDATILAVALLIAAAASEALQESVIALLLNGPDASRLSISFVALVGGVCGAIVGYFVPAKCRENLRTPPDRIMAQALQSLRAEADEKLGDDARAESWLFEARSELNGITPAEAVQYKGRATSAWRLLSNVSAGIGVDSRRPVADRSGPVVIEGGRGSAQRRD
jgi:hypothetical protein